MRIGVIGVGAVSPAGARWRGLRDAVTDAREVTHDPDPRSGAERLARRLMARGAYLAHLATLEALDDAGWSGDVTDVGMFMGVGASGGSIEQIEAMVEPSLVAGELSWEAFGSAGLRACNPLFAFQLMNNFSMCHAAILAGTRGPNRVFFSRGGGTVTAIEEAAWAIAEGDCRRALAGASDTALDPVTAAEIERAGGEPGNGSEAAVVLALGGDTGDALAVMTCCDPSAGAPRSPGIVVSCDEVQSRFGASLAAVPALACAIAIDHIAAGQARVHVVGHGLITFEERE